MGKTDVIGILSIVFAFVMAPIGIILGIVGIVQNRKRNESIVLSLIGLILSIILLPLTFIIIGTIAYFGVLDPSSLIPVSCSAEAGFGCTVMTISGNDVEIELVNGMGRNVEVIDLRPGLTICDDIRIGDRLIANGAKTRIELLGCEKTRSSHNIELGIIYQYADIPLESRINLTSTVNIIG